MRTIRPGLSSNDPQRLVSRSRHAGIRYTLQHRANHEYRSYPRRQRGPYRFHDALGPLIPWWFKGPGKLPLLHNARSETVHEKKLFKASFHRQRCLVPASGFFEWQRLPDGRKQPFYISSRDGYPLSFAGIWDSATTEGGEKLDSCAILTTDCNALMQPIHDRMPVVLGPHDWDTWLNPSTAA